VEKLDVRSGSRSHPASLSASTSESTSRLSVSGEVSSSGGARRSAMVDGRLPWG
jgi:hypothetical protein